MENFNWELSLFRKKLGTNNISERDVENVLNVLFNHAEDDLIDYLEDDTMKKIIKYIIKITRIKDELENDAAEDEIMREYIDNSEENMDVASEKLLKDDDVYYDGTESDEEDDDMNEGFNYNDDDDDFKYGRRNAKSNSRRENYYAARNRMEQDIDDTLDVNIPKNHYKYWDNDVDKEPGYLSRITHYSSDASNDYGIDDEYFETEVFPIEQNKFFQLIRGEEEPEDEVETCFYSNKWDVVFCTTVEGDTYVYM